MRRGFTLFELVTALFLAGLVVATLLPAARRSRDRMAVVGAREAVVSLLATTRGEALRRGGAVLVVDPTRSLLTVESGGVVRVRENVADRYGVSLIVPGASGEARLAFDALGIGRAASRTLLLRRARASAAVVVSAYGRVSRR